MEYVPKIDISGLKMMVKSALEKVFLKSLNQRGQIMPTHWLCLPKKIPDYAPDFYCSSYRTGCFVLYIVKYSKVSIKYHITYEVQYY